LLTIPGATPAAELIRQWLVLWEKQRKFPYPLMLHDPLAVYYAACPQVCRMVPASVVVLTEGYGRGMTLNVDAYRKAPMNPAYRDFSWDKKVMAAESVCREDMMAAFMACLL
jgi:inosine-uridine nucleoside N-ribohydrolase